MPIDSVRAVAGRGTVVTGRISEGAVKIGDSVTITRLGGKPPSSMPTGMKMSGEAMASARAGDTVGVLLRGVDPRAVARGHILQAG
jgi:elongation factor Tu